MSTMRDAGRSSNPRNKGYALRATITDDYGNKVSLKRCKTCLRWLEDNEQNYYHSTPRPYAKCIPCVKEKQRQHRQKPEVKAKRKVYQAAHNKQMRADPYVNELLRKREKEWRDRVKNTEEYKRKKREYDRARRAKIYADPEKHKEFLATKRIEQRLQRERKGIQSQPNKGKHHLKFPVEQRRVRLPIGPIRDWLNRAVRNAPVGQIEKLAADAGLDPGQLRRIRREGEEIELYLVEKLLRRTNILVEDLYPDLDNYLIGEEEEAA
jgi:hypothetical protein